MFNDTVKCTALPPPELAEGSTPLPDVSGFVALKWGEENKGESGEQPQKTDLELLCSERKYRPLLQYFSGFKVKDVDEILNKYTEAAFINLVKPEDKMRLAIFLFNFF